MGWFDNDEKYQKLKDLRDSGYKGGVDEKGDKSDKYRDVFEALDRARRREGR